MNILLSELKTQYSFCMLNNFYCVPEEKDPRKQVFIVDFSCTQVLEMRKKRLRVCTPCDHNEIEDEFHLIMKCPSYSDIRKMYTKKHYYKKTKYIQISKFTQYTKCERIM